MERWLSLPGKSCCASSCCSPESGKNRGADETAQAIGYSPEEITAVPEGSNLGLGCGNPQAIASLKAGETVLDLGSGAGFDVFLAARQVGDSGLVIGVDMTSRYDNKGTFKRGKERFPERGVPIGRNRTPASCE